MFRGKLLAGLKAQGKPPTVLPERWVVDCKPPGSRRLRPWSTWGVTSTAASSRSATSCAAMTPG
ncbi:MAG: hypothetical protein MZW92_55235 [Comamonadaceae bacterium]|nr:hypothetical protein [Comamonadaceae bacterium]